jgi:putative toxin-antitoxin system antitoxin component (TIGR02293 family)
MARDPINARASEPLATIARLRAGLPYKALEDVVKALGMSREEVARAIGIAPRTLIRRKQERRLSQGESERVAR